MSAVSWRPFRPGDEERLREIHRLQCAAVGAETDFIDLGDAHNLLVRVAERDGEVVGAVVAHSTVELLWISADAALLLSAVHSHDLFRDELRAAGVAEVYIWELEATLAKLERTLKRLGFRRSNPDYVPFYREV